VLLYEAKIEFTGTDPRDQSQCPVAAMALSAGRQPNLTVKSWSPRQVGRNLGRNNPMHQYRLEADLLESSSV